MISGSSVLIIPFITGVEGADMFNFFFSLVGGIGFIGFVPLALMKLIQRA